jgi:PiT family inorganic phosphate transporter
MLPLLGGVYLGWGLGANNAANVFGTAVAARIISFRKAAILCALAVVVGAVLQGKAGIRTLSGLTIQTGSTLILVSMSAAITVTLMTICRLPISTSQAIVGAIAGVGLSTQTMYWDRLVKVVLCWVATPIGAMVFSLIIYRLLNIFFRKVTVGILTRDKILLWGLIAVGTYGSYALGANNVANATGIFSGQIDGMTDTHLALIGGTAIALGVITYGKRVMLAVGSEILKLNAFTAFIAVSSTAITVYIFALIGVPVSASQAIVGAIVGIGLIHGVYNIRFKMLRDIGVGWLLTPVISLIFSAAGYAIFI